MKKIIYVTTLSLLLSLVAGCFSTGNSSNTNYFSLSAPIVSKTNSFKVNTNYEIQVLPFTSTGPYSSNMVFVQPPNSIFFDSSNCWAQKPSIMLCNYFTLFLGHKIVTQSTNIKKYTLNGEILNFDGDLKSEKAICSIKLRLTDNNGNIILSKVYSASSKMKKVSASGFAKAQSESVEEIADSFFKDLNKIK